MWCAALAGTEAICAEEMTIATVVGTMLAGRMLATNAGTVLRERAVLREIDRGARTADREDTSGTGAIRAVARAAQHGTVQRVGALITETAVSRSVEDAVPAPRQAVAHRAVGA
jgi:hypothetical protein